MAISKINTMDNDDGRQRELRRLGGYGLRQEMMIVIMMMTMTMMMRKR